VRVSPPRSGNPHPQVACPKTCHLPILNLVGEQRCAIYSLFVVITNIDVMVAESTRVAQVEDLVASISAEDNTVQTSAGEPSAVEFVAAPVVAEATTITLPEVPATTSVSTEPAAGLFSAPGELAPISVDTPRVIIERGSGSAPAGLYPSMDIMEELAHQMVH